MHKQELNKGYSNGHAKEKQSETMRPYQKTTGNRGKLEAKYLVFPRVENNSDYPIQKISTKNTHKSNIMQTEKVIFRNIHIYSYVNVCI